VAGVIHSCGFVTRAAAAALLTTGLMSGAVFASDGQGPVWHKEATTPKYDRAGLEQCWRGRIQGFLDRGVIPFMAVLMISKECLAARLAGYGTNGVPNPPYIDQVIAYA
jgi:hypothetical protein